MGLLLGGVFSGSENTPVLNEVEPVETDTVASAIKLGKTIAVFNPVERNISVTNPFGEEVRSVGAAASELKHLVTDRRKELLESDFLKCRIDYLVKVLKHTYVPSFTVEFMNLAMSGDWSHQYSNAVLRRRDASLNYRIVQKIIPENSKIDEEGDSDGRLEETNNRAVGKIVNEVRWDVLDNQDKLNMGELSVKANYSINSRGALALSLNDHVMSVEKLTLEPTDLIMAIQRSVPFQFFDPTDSMVQNVYIDPKLRIAETNGAIFAGVYDIFVREDGDATAREEGESDVVPTGEGGGGGGKGFGTAKLRKSQRI
jgi:hypothetical protein